MNQDRTLQVAGGEVAEPEISKFISRLVKILTVDNGDGTYTHMISCDSPPAAKLVTIYDEEGI